MKYWLKGPKTGKTEVALNLQGFADNVRLNEKGQFWVAIDCCRTHVQVVFANNPWVKNIYFRLPIPMKYLAKMAGMKMYTVVSLFDHERRVLDVLEDRKGKVMKLVSEVREISSAVVMESDGDSVCAHERNRENKNLTGTARYASMNTHL